MGSCRAPALAGSLALSLSSVPAQECLQNPLGLPSPFLYKPGPSLSPLSLLQDPVILVFISTGQTMSSKKSEDLLAMVKKLQKGHVSPSIWGFESGVRLKPSLLNSQPVEIIPFHFLPLRQFIL